MNNKLRPEKIRRKLQYIQRMRFPHPETGASNHTWTVFWRILFKLKLTQKLYHYF